MLVIGHRGAAGLASENTLEALRAGINAGTDMLEFDIQLTADSVPILVHNRHFHGRLVKNHTLSELLKIAPVTALQEVLDEFFGRIILNIELKHESSARIVYNTVKLYVTKPEDWDNVLFSSFRVQALLELRQLDKRANLAMLHHVNPFLFMKYQRQLNLTAVGFHRLHANTLAVAVAKELGIFTYVYTVDRPAAALRFSRRGVDGLVTNYPDKVISALQSAA